MSTDKFDSTDPALWPRAYDFKVSYWLQMDPDLCHNRDAIYKKSVRQSEGMRKCNSSAVVNRRLNASAFQSVSPNGETIHCYWRLYIVFSVLFANYSVLIVVLHLLVILAITGQAFVD